MPNRGQQQPPRHREQPRGKGTFSPDDDETVDSEDTLRQQAEQGDRKRADRKDRRMEDQPETGEAEDEDQRQ